MLDARSDRTRFWTASSWISTNPSVRTLVPVTPSAHAPYATSAAARSDLRCAVDRDRRAGAANPHICGGLRWRMRRPPIGAGQPRARHRLPAPADPRSALGCPACPAAAESSGPAAIPATGSSGDGFQQRAVSAKAPPIRSGSAPVSRQAAPASARGDRQHGSATAAAGGTGVECGAGQAQAPAARLCGFA